jgi:hypothetical protein
MSQKMEDQIIANIAAVLPTIFLYFLCKWLDLSDKTFAISLYVTALSAINIIAIKVRRIEASK